MALLRCGTEHIIVKFEHLPFPSDDCQWGWNVHLHSCSLSQPKYEQDLDIVDQTKTIWDESSIVIT